MKIFKVKVNLKSEKEKKTLPLQKVYRKQVIIKIDESSFLRMYVVCLLLRILVPLLVFAKAPTYLLFSY